jgi:hypothetical protein
MRLVARAVAIAVVVACPAASAAAGAPAAAVQRVERFEADFLYRTKDRRLVEYAVVARRVSDVASGQTLDVTVEAGVRPCTLENEILSCSGHLRAQRVVRFEATSDMAAGMLVFRDGNDRVSRLVLEADDPYQATGQSVPNSCGGATVLAFEHAYNATATGTLLGRKVATRTETDPELEAMTRYVELEACP